MRELVLLLALISVSAVFGQESIPLYGTSSLKFASSMSKNATTGTPITNAVDTSEYIFSVRYKNGTACIGLAYAARTLLVPPSCLRFGDYSDYTVCTSTGICQKVYGFYKTPSLISPLDGRTIPVYQIFLTKSVANYTINYGNYSALAITFNNETDLYTGITNLVRVINCTSYGNGCTTLAPSYVEGQNDGSFLRVSGYYPNSILIGNEAGDFNFGGVSSFYDPISNTTTYSYGLGDQAIQQYMPGVLLRSSASPVFKSGAILNGASITSLGIVVVDDDGNVYDYASGLTYGSAGSNLLSGVTKIHSTSSVAMVLDNPSVCPEFQACSAKFYYSSTNLVSTAVPAGTGTSYTAPQYGQRAVAALGSTAEYYGVDSAVHILVDDTNSFSVNPIDIIKTCNKYSDGLTPLMVNIQNKLYTIYVTAKDGYYYGCSTYIQGRKLQLLLNEFSLTERTPTSSVIVGSSPVCTSTILVEQFTTYMPYMVTSNGQTFVCTSFSLGSVSQLNTLTYNDPSSIMLSASSCLTPTGGMVSCTIPYSASMLGYSRFAIAYHMTAEQCSEFPGVFMGILPVDGVAHSAYTTDAPYVAWTCMSSMVNVTTVACMNYGGCSFEYLRDVSSVDDINIVGSIIPLENTPNGVQVNYTSLLGKCSPPQYVTGCATHGLGGYKTYDQPTGSNASYVTLQTSTGCNAPSAGYYYWCMYKDYMLSAAIVVSLCLFFIIVGIIIMFWWRPIVWKVSQYYYDSGYKELGIGLYNHSKELVQKMFADVADLNYLLNYKFDGTAKQRAKAEKALNQKHLLGFAMQKPVLGAGNIFYHKLTTDAIGSGVKSILKRKDPSTDSTYAPIGYSSTYANI